MTVEIKWSLAKWNILVDIETPNKQISFKLSKDLIERKGMISAYPVKTIFLLKIKLYTICFFQSNTHTHTLKILSFSQIK